MSHSTAPVVGAALIVTAGLAAQLLAFRAPNPIAADALERFLARPVGAHQYRASRRLEASGGGRSGWLDVESHFTTDSGLQYEITSEGGSGYIRNHVLRPLLEEEQQLVSGGSAAASAIAPVNYFFHPIKTDEEGLAVVRLEPRRKDQALVRGHMLLTAGEGELVRVEGTMAKNPSFWVRRVHLVRSYSRIEGALMPVMLETKAQLRLFGSATLRMTYRYSEIDERVVDDVTPPSSP